MEMTRKKIADLQQAWRDNPGPAFIPYLKTNPRLYKIHAELRRTYSEQGARLVVKGRIAHLNYRCAYCSGYNFGPRPYCSTACVRAAGESAAAISGWRLVSVVRTKSWRLKLKCLTCGKVKRYGLNWLSLDNPYSCSCLRGSKIGDSRRSDPAEVIKELSRANPRLRFTSDYVNAPTPISYICKVHKRKGSSLTCNLRVGSGCKSCGLEKYRANSILNYGTEFPVQSQEVQDRIRSSMRARYGCDHALQNKNIFNKMVTSSFRRKPITLCGKSRRLQGYEPQAVRYLVRVLGVDPKDIACGDDPRLPSFRYELGGKIKVYHPDIFLVSKRLVIEVKGAYTYSVSLKRNRIKRNVVLDAGYRFKFFIFDPVTKKPMSPKNAIRKD